MERKGASYRITGSKSQQVEPPARGMRPVNQWTGSNGESYAHDRALTLSVNRHPSGGFNAEVANHSWVPEDPDLFRAGPFRTPLRAQVAAEALGERTTNASKPSPDSYRRGRYG